MYLEFICPESRGQCLPVFPDKQQIHLIIYNFVDNGEDKKCFQISIICPWKPPPELPVAGSYYLNVLKGILNNDFVYGVHCYFAENQFASGQFIWVISYGFC